MAQLKQYVCNFYKELQLGKDVKFRNGFFETDNPETQAQIESSQGFGVHIHFKDSLKEMERVGRERQEKEAAEKAEKTNQKAVLQQVLLAQIENLLENYLLTYDEKYVTEANNLIVKTVALSSDLPTDPDYLHILFIEAHFALVDGDIVKATSLLNSAESIDRKSVV